MFGHRAVVTCSLSASPVPTPMTKRPSSTVLLDGRSPRPRRNPVRAGQGDRVAGVAVPIGAAVEFDGDRIRRTAGRRRSPSLRRTRRRIRETCREV